MKEEHKQLCLAVLDILKTTNPQDYSYFPTPAIDTLEDEKSKSKYRELVSDPRDLGMIRFIGLHVLIPILSLRILYFDPLAAKIDL